MTEARRPLEDIRIHVDAIDEQLLDLLALRRALAAEAWGVKQGLGLPRVDPDRERALTERWARMAGERALPEGPVLEILGRLLEITRGEPG